MHFICHCIYHVSEQTFVLVYVELPANNLDKNMRENNTLITFGISSHTIAFSSCKLRIT